MDNSTISMAIFHGYVELPEGTSGQRIHNFFWHQSPVDNFRTNLFVSTFECGTDFVVTHLPTCHAMVRGVNQKSISRHAIVQKVWLGYLELFGFLAIINMQASCLGSPKVAEGNSVLSPRSEVCSITQSSQPLYEGGMMPA